MFLFGPLSDGAIIFVSRQGEHDGKQDSESVVLGSTCTFCRRLKMYTDDDDRLKTVYVLR